MVTTLKNVYPIFYTPIKPVKMTLGPFKPCIGNIYIWHELHVLKLQQLLALKLFYSFTQIYSEICEIENLINKRYMLNL